MLGQAFHFKHVNQPAEKKEYGAKVIYYFSLSPFFFFVTNYKPFQLALAPSALSFTDQIFSICQPALVNAEQSLSFIEVSLLLSSFHTSSPTTRMIQKKKKSKGKEEKKKKKRKKNN